MDIKLLIEQLLQAVGGRQDDLARLLDTDQPQISRWKSGSEPRGVYRDRIYALAVKHGIVAGPASGRAGRQAGPMEFVSVPIISWVSAGKLADSDTQIPADDWPRVSVAGLGNGEFFALRVSGNSMDRISPEGSLIIVNKRQRVLQDGKPYIFAVRGEATYKLWKSKPPRLQPYSTDPVNDPIFIDRRNSLAIVGRVRRSIFDL